MALFLLLSIAFTVNGQTYCTCGPSTTVDSNLGSVSLQGMTQSINDESNCPGTIGPRDLTNLVADLGVASNYILKFNVTTCGSFFPTLSGAWIDYNQNEVFETDESLFPFVTLVTGGYQEKTFTVPATAKPGKTRMRVQVQETSSTNMDPCTSFPYGGTKDFSVQIGATSPYCFIGVGPTSILDMNLGSVLLQGDSRAIFDTTDCPGKLGVQDFTKTQIADLTVGNVYTLQANVTTCGGIYPVISGAWIDWYQTLIFDETNQLYPFSNARGLNVKQFAVPADAFPGLTTMRVQVQETDANSIKSCDPFTYGATKDFGISVLSNVKYCNSGPLLLDGTNLGLVFLQGASKAIDDTSDCPGKAGPQDFTSYVADLRPNTPYVLKYNITICDGARQLYELSGAWVDWDRSGTFVANEALFPLSSVPGYQERIFTTPDFVVRGPTRMRVQVQAVPNGTATLDPCASFTIGGTKDFTINLIS